MEFKGTKGKWELDGTTVKNDIKLVCNCVSNGINFTKEDKANAKLIAAAPEMFEILKELSTNNFQIEQLLKKITE